MKLSARWKKLKQTPLRMIEWVIVIQTVLGGLYILSPLVEELARTLSGTSVIAQIIGSPIGIAVTGGIYLGSGLALAAGLLWDKKQLRATGLFVNVLVRIYGIIGGWLINGLFPPSWLASASLVAIIVILYFVIKREQKNGASN